MNKNLEIKDFEDKTTQAGKKYVRFNTSEGWMSCFDSKTSNELKEHIGENVNVNVKIDDEKGFTNILKYLGAMNNTENDEEKLVKTAVMTNLSGFPISMKVAYAKDLFCVLINDGSEKGMEDAMRVSINLIKQAEAAFIPEQPKPPIPKLKPVNVKKEIVKMLAEHPDMEFEVEKFIWEKTEVAKAVNELLDAGIVFEPKPNNLKYLG